MQPPRAVDSFNASVTSVEFPWPAGLTGLERIMLSANGDLQRLLSAFFAQPITIARISTTTSPRPRAISPAHPVTQTRRVHLRCAARTACVATSTVRITAPACARLFLDEHYAIGQLFRRMRAVPAFDLLAVGTGASGARNTLWRRYTLRVDGFECEIREEFPDRAMFARGPAWLADADPAGDAACGGPPRPPVRRPAGSWMDATQGHVHVLLIFLAVAVLLYFPESAVHVQVKSLLAAGQEGP